MKTTEEKLQERLTDPAFRRYYNSRSASIRELIDDYPFETYQIKKDAPATGRIPAGARVRILYYLEGRNVMVAQLDDEKKCASFHVANLEMIETT